MVNKPAYIHNFQNTEEDIRQVEREDASEMKLLESRPDTVALIESIDTCLDLSPDEWGEYLYVCSDHFVYRHS